MITYLEVQGFSWDPELKLRHTPELLYLHYY